MVQSFHSIHEIDPEFIPAIEHILQEEVPSFQVLVDRHDFAPESDVFTYFLFFGPTQNTPIGFAQVCIKSLNTKPLISFWHRIFKFWDKDHRHWKQVTIKVGDGNSGIFVFDPRFLKAGRDKFSRIIADYESREEIKAISLYTIKGIQDHKCSWQKSEHEQRHDRFVLEPLFKNTKSYQDYLKALDPQTSGIIKSSWKKLHQSDQVQLGDYPNALEAPKTLPVSQEIIEQWNRLNVQILTFEKDLEVLGCILIYQGKNGNYFFEPMPFETDEEAVVPDELYTQYAILKFYEMSSARKCHMMKFGAKLHFEDKEDLSFFQDQGFTSKTVQYSFTSRLTKLGHEQ